MRYLTSLLIAAAMSLPLSCTAAAPAAYADDLAQPHHANGVFCDTLEQAHAFVAAYKGGDPRPVLHDLNAKFGDHACGLANTVAQQSAQYDKLINDSGTWQFVQVQVLAQLDPVGVIHPFQPPRTWYTAYKVSEPVKGSSI